MMKYAKIYVVKALMVVLVFVFLTISVMAKQKSQPRAKFYDFNEQLIDGEIKKPTTLYTDSREAVKFDRLLRLKKSFINKLFNTAKEKVFK
mgnify:CR=1 FL=1